MLPRPVQASLLWRFFHRHKMKWSRHYSTSRLSWLCLLAVHSVIEMGVRVHPGRKSACQLAFSALFPISIKHLHHLLWAHSTTPGSPPEPCTSDRWRVLGTNHFSSPANARLTPFLQMSLSIFVAVIVSLGGVVVEMSWWEYQGNMTHTPIIYWCHPI